ncbi:MFS transporter [Calothrix sp. FACHB-1219]|uniref:MFS transporter n=1 Tax=unclassified Calothrix TaxID=2619626 RepID=UPI001686D183|nr:MFS transporter [Calothrix sp. FACHB-168]MBD2203487.1 MFS transporter [Calothrix sp. FACHB-168]MBD2219079.1 MFS transporter [Calothrix sp. FACHB-1219]
MKTLSLSAEELLKSSSPLEVELIKAAPASALIPWADSPPKISKQATRTSLKASTLDGVFAAIFSNITGGVLLVNFLLQLGANPVEIGLLSSIPLLTNFLQPFGAYLADRTTSRHWYTMMIFGPSRLLWLVLVGGIAWFCCSDMESHQLVIGTLAIILITNILGALGGCAWFSWMAALVPPALRGRYFGLRNSAGSLANLLSVPVLGYIISAYPGGDIQAYAILLFFGVIIGLISLACQFWMVDVNPQVYRAGKTASPTAENSQDSQPQPFTIFKDRNFLKFLLYVGLWTFAVNLSSPFFNLYLLKNLDLNLTTVTLYASLLAGANLVMLVIWGKLADRVGNRPILLLVGSLIAVTPLFWLGLGSDLISVWLWLPLIYLIWGGFGAAIDLCNSNIQMEMAPLDSPSQYFAIAAAVTGVCGGLGATTGGFLAQLDIIGGLPGLFALSAALRLIALFPLFFVREPRSKSLTHVIEKILPFKAKAKLVSTEKMAV